jgi:DNA-binding LytR/AlgR family response regulator
MAMLLRIRQMNYISSALYQVEEDVKRSYICRASKTMLVNMDKIQLVRDKNAMYI